MYFSNTDNFSNKQIHSLKYNKSIYYSEIFFFQFDLLFSFSFEENNNFTLLFKFVNTHTLKYKRQSRN